MAKVSKMPTSWLALLFHVSTAMGLKLWNEPIKAWIKLKVKTTRVAERPIYHDYPIMYA